MNDNKEEKEEWGKEERNERKKNMKEKLKVGDLEKQENTIKYGDTNESGKDRHKISEQLWLMLYLLILNTIITKTDFLKIGFQNYLG